MTVEELTVRCTELPEDGFIVHLDACRDAWDAAIRETGRRSAYRRMAAKLSEMYRERYGREFLFSERCMAFEIRYHADAYFAVTVGGYPRHLTTFLFSRAMIEEHCREINISVYDLRSRRQRLMFRYRFGIRPCYRKTPLDPYRTLGRMRSISWMSGNGAPGDPAAAGKEERV